MQDNDKSLRDELKELAASDDAELTPLDARKKAMDLLARREHAHSELMRKLGKAGFSAEMANDAISELAREGLQSDQRFVEAFVQSRYSAGKGPIRVRAELRDRDVDEGLVDAALGEFEGDWFALAVLVRQKKFGAEQTPDFKEKARQMRFLQYRGFEQAHILAALGED